MIGFKIRNNLISEDTLQKKIISKLIHKTNFIILKYYDKNKRKKPIILSKHILSKCFYNLLMHNELQKWFLIDA